MFSLKTLRDKNELKYKLLVRKLVIGCSTSTFLFIIDLFPSDIVTQIQKQATSNWFSYFKAINLEKEEHTIR